MRIPVRGPGRPKKWKGPTDIITLRLPLEVIEILDRIAAETNSSRTEVIVSLVKSASNVDVSKLILKLNSLEKYVAQLEKERQALLEERERLLRQIEKLQLKLEQKGRSVVSSRMSRIIDALARVEKEGRTFADTMVEIGVEHPQEQLAVLKDLFIVHNEGGEIAEVLRPVQGIKKLKGWVLVKGKESGLLNYVWARESVLEVAKQVRKTKVVNVRKEVEERLSSWLRTYNLFLKDSREEAEKFLDKVLSKGLPELVEKYGLDVVREVVLSKEEFVRVFGPFLPPSSVSLKKAEVVGDE
ncbi:ribbon-helix-helix protein, CopG family [Pyrococcus horikoshii]|uniref:Ribbon-helix-helix protein CopG domain-containing protein n=1 Tax=Pyrococcus horikoshii (strain ATCC 700860 / DSM 12428 / JCM 9974 / NBRC 100139 / OT-3) TaxID=70601 RepID=O58918_PYRHO|nr:ribbon-helix-helix protein, CopG family [Pyrococcus horikoshii]BAA30278.1 298aa long hypothetical protein [Pyrococcus horikoshii OT3]